MRPFPPSSSRARRAVLAAGLKAVPELLGPGASAAITITDGHRVVVKGDAGSDPVRIALRGREPQGVLAVGGRAPEGIEERGQMAPLQRLGCDLAQGYLFARPASAAALATLAGTHVSRSRGGAAPREATRAS
jgi:hypothetical protein